MLEVGSVTAEGFVGSIKEWGVDGIQSILSPIPVRLVPLIITLCTQGLLVRPDVITVPAKEVARGVDEQRLVDMGSDEIVVAAASSWDDARRSGGRLLLEAKHSVDIIKAFLAREGRPNKLAGPL